MPALMVSGGTLRLVVGAVPITLLIVLFGLVVLISLVLPKERRDYVLELAPIVVQLVRAIAPQAAARR
ncbi:hypothetical protein OHA70_19730 [Kribbella sp. NBC_00382]|uniref:hypothetical protein n=1 Tax=Kribbella sp. NBC_00382 TaxID=2975967 RepID=UPI002E21016E